MTILLGSFSSLINSLQRREMSSYNLNRGQRREEVATLFKLRAMLPTGNTGSAQLLPMRESSHGCMLSTQIADSSPWLHVASIASWLHSAY